MGGNGNAKAYRQSDGPPPDYPHERGFFTIIKNRRGFICLNINLISAAGNARKECAPLSNFLLVSGCNFYLTAFLPFLFFNL